MKIEVSIGEVVDKITILQIKKEKIDNETKLKYISEELNTLNKSLKKENIQIPEELIQNLKKVWKR
jgi:FtsZ-binding cell division protein ZapB